MLEFLPEILKGLHTSLTLTIASLFVALVLSLLFTIVLTLKTPIITPLVKIYITLFTGTPLLVQIFLIYYGPGSSRLSVNIRGYGACCHSHGCAQ